MCFRAVCQPHLELLALARERRGFAVGGVGGGGGDFPRSLRPLVVAAVQVDACGKQIFDTRRSHWASFIISHRHTRI
jgi:hypothetical protein